jgi:putative spermidine/putrescine transport system substrate-binding protein
MSKKTDFALPRRDFLKAVGITAMAGAIGAPLLAASTGAQAASKNLVMVSWGGNYRTAVEKALTEPFEKETGIKVTLIDTPDLAKVKAQMMTGNIEWDIFDATGPMVFSGEKNNYWEPLDSGLVDASDLITPPSKFAVPFYGYTGGICWDDNRHPAGKHPMNFAEYFDVGKFPGTRTLRNRAVETLESALLADGVAPADMYPLDVERAFKMLDKIKPHIGKWVEQTPQTVSLVQTGEVDYSYTYATRAKAASEAGQPIKFSFDQNLIGLEYLVVLKNSPNKANAMKFLSFAMRPENQAALMDLHGNTPANNKAVALMNPETRQWLSNPSNTQNVLISDTWWAEHYDELTSRFKLWALS